MNPLKIPKTNTISVELEKLLFEMLNIYHSKRIS